MDLTQLANLGEFIGGVAALVTLVYLGLHRPVRIAQFYFGQLGCAGDSNGRA